MVKVSNYRVSTHLQDLTNWSPAIRAKQISIVVSHTWRSFRGTLLASIHYADFPATEIDDRPIIHTQVKSGWVRADKVIKIMEFNEIRAHTGRWQVRAVGTNLVISAFETWSLVSQEYNIQMMVYLTSTNSASYYMTLTPNPWSTMYKLLEI